jgi:hypothetical protein
MMNLMKGKTGLTETRVKLYRLKGLCLADTMNAEGKQPNHGPENEDAAESLLRGRSYHTEERS